MCVFNFHFINYSYTIIIMKLSAYANNYNKLLKYAESMHIKVVYSDVNACAQWAPTTKTITLSNDFSGKKEEIAFLLHELGHARDDYSQRDKGYTKYLDLCYKRFNKLINNKCYMTNNQKMSVIYTEHRAWEHGIDIDNSLGIKLGKWYYKEMKDGLLSYFEYAYPKSFKQKYEEFLNE